MTKLLTIYFDGAFSAKFSTPPSGKTTDGSQKRFWSKMMARTTSITLQNFVEIARRTSAWEDEVWRFFVYNAPEITVTGDLVALLQQEIVLAFLGRFRCGLQHFFSGKKIPFSLLNSFQNFRYGALWLVPKWPEKNLKSGKMGAKFMRTTSTIMAFRSKVKENFYHSFLPHILLMCTRISLPRYRVPQ